MKVVITGGGGFIGRKLAAKLLQKGTLAGTDGSQQSIDELVLFDMVAPPADETGDNRIKVVTGDLTDCDLIAGLIDADTTSVFHLAAVVSAGAEADFDLGYKVNLDGTRLVLDACRALPHAPRLVFASSIAVYGGREIPDVVDDATPLMPQTSYGTQKVIGELLVNDYSRKGYIDGRAMRLPTVVVRPGKPNKAASGFASSIVREPLNGIDFECPVRPESEMAVMSPRAVVDAFMHMHDIDAEGLGDSRALLLPGLRVSQADSVAAIGRVAGDRKVGRIDFKIDPDIQAIVDGWPKGTHSARAEALGFKGDTNMDDIVRAHIEDELSAPA